MNSEEIKNIYRIWQDRLRKENKNEEGGNETIALPTNDAANAELKRMLIECGVSSDEATKLVYEDISRIFNLLEGDDDKYQSVGYGKYKLKTDIGPDGKGKEGTPTYTKDDAGNYVETGKDDDEKDDEEEKEEKPSVSQNYAQDGEERDPTQTSVDGSHLTNDKQEDDGEKIEDIVNSFADEINEILKGEKSPPGTGGSAVGEMYGGVALEEYNETSISEDDFVNKHFDDVRNSSVSKGMSDGDIKTWLKVSYKTGVSEIEELKGNAKYRFKDPQSEPYPIGVMDPVNDKGGSKKRLLDLMNKKLQEANDAGDSDSIKHYNRQIRFINSREDSDTGILYETTDGLIGFKHTSNKKAFTEPVFNTTVNKRGEVMKSAIDAVSNEYNIDEGNAKTIEKNIDTTIQKAVSSIEEAGQGPSGAINNNVGDTSEFASKHKLGKQFQNLGAGSKGRSDYLSGIKKDIEANKGLGKKVNNVLQERALQPPYSDDDIAGAVLELSKRGDTTTSVNKMVVKLSDNVKLAREVHDRIRKQNPDLSDEEVKQKTVETINGYKTDDGVPFDIESLDTLLSPEMNWIEKVGAQTRDAMGAAHEQIVTDLTDADEKYQKEKEPNPPQPPVNGPHTQAYIQSYMKQMHWDRYILGEEEDIGDMNIGGKSVNSTMIRGCLAELSGYTGDLDSEEGKQQLMAHLRKTMRVSSESQSLTFNGEKNDKPIEIGKEQYRTKGVGNNGILGNFGKDLQKCLKSK